MTTHTLSPELLRKTHAYWRAANYLSVGQIYLYDNPLLKEPLKLSHVKPLVVGHWGTTPGQNFLYVHLNRVIKKYDLDMFYIAGPGHGGPALVANTYLEGTYSEIYPNISQDEAGLRLALHQGQAHHLCLPRLPVARAPTHLPPDQPQPPRPGIQGGRHHHDALRHEGAERPGPLPPGSRRGGPDTPPGRQGRLPEADGQDKLIEHKLFIDKHGRDLPEVRNWMWSNAR